MTLVAAKEVLIAQLLAARTQIDATLAILGVKIQEDEEDDECQHPKDQRENLSTMGGPDEWRCRLCDFHSITPRTEE